jgi:transcriptional regulator with GAF, ATPase, and Fis domain
MERHQTFEPHVMIPPMPRSSQRPEPETSTVAQPLACGILSLPGIKLTVLEGPDRGQEVTARRGVVRIGTERDNDLVLTDDAVSRRHLEVRLSSDEVRVRDLGSTNGTIVDGVRICEAILSAASLIRLGSSTIRATPVDEPVKVLLSTRARFGGQLGRSTAIREVFAILERVAPSEATVVIEGETGTGKELAAEAIHAHSPRAQGPFVAVDCGAIPHGLVESELFGHVRGAFTGAVQERRGVFEEADGGTLFLDEVGELPLELQPKLLRALEKREVRRVGASQSRKIDVRVLAATNRDLAAEVNRGNFREDLFFRLAVVRVRLPPLRARRDDIPMLIRHFVECLRPDRLDRVEPLVAALANRSFPGNIRELRNAVQRELTLGDELAPGETSTERVAAAEFRPLLDLPYKEGMARLVEQFEREYLEHALGVCGGSVSGAARRAGLSRRYVQTLMVRHGWREPPDGED